MIYLKHNIRGNIMNADGVGDSKMKNDIILSEIAKLIVIKPDVVITYLNKSGFNVSDNIGTRSLVKKVGDAINKSKQFATYMAEEINGIGRAEKKMNSDGGTQTTDYASMANSTASIVASLADLFGKPKKSKSTTQVQQYTHPVQQQTGIGGMETGTTVLIGFAIAVPLLIGGFFAIRALNK